VDVPPVSATAVSHDHDWAPLVDVSELSIAELLTSDDSVLARSLQRVIEGLDDPDGTISAFQSFTS